MITRWIALLGLAAALGGCAAVPSAPLQPEAWNGGVWNSMLGYHGPSNANVMGGPSR